MRILHLTYSHDNLLPLFRQYGRAMRAAGHHVTAGYLVGTPAASFMDDDAADRVCFFDLPSTHTKGLRWSVMRAMSRVIGGERFDLAVCHQYKSAKAVAFAYRGPIIWVLHGIGGIRRLSHRLLVRWLGSRLWFIVVAEAVRADVLWSCPWLATERVCMIHNSIDVLEVRNHLLAREEGRRQLGVGPEDFVYGTVGRLVPEKGHALLLTAFARMASPYSRSRLVIIGDGPLASELLRHAQRLGVERRVVFAGFKENAAMLMSAFDVFVLSSRRLPGLAGEGLPRVLLEAMAAGIPIVATDVGGVREAVGSTAICMPDDDAGKLASALSRMADMPRERRDEMAAAARLRVESEFRSDHFRHQIQEWVHRVFAESKL